VVRLRYQDTRLNWVSVLGGDLAAPHDVDVDSRGRVYVADTDNNRIVVYNAENEPAAAWDSELEGPTGVCVIDHAADYNQYGTDHAAVIDRNRTRLNLFTLSGQLRKRIDLRRIGLAEAGFAYMAHDRHGNLYVTDQVNDRVHVFDPQLKYIVSYGNDNEINSPRGIVIWRKFGQVFLNEAEGGRYYWIGLDGYMIGFYPQEFDSRRPGTTIALYITEVADVTVTVSDDRNRTVRTLTPPHNQRPGEVLIVWDGNDDDGNLVPPGDYRVHAVIRPTYSRPKRTFKKELVGTVRRIPDN
jgi:DNA-binding beta-propeller fold protein YncE